MATKKQPVIIKEWNVIGGQDNFTVLGLGADNKVYFWKDKKWNEL
jgi:hypothetical protein